ncbi:glycosyltransferase [Ginsengibacter hankyongi]|uniref:glycosyltransferase n=1 Tax=Ginsengibacter hankyongi TaxID=2607284 RepID=UPI001F1B4572|nr:glycosyltransferase [Ginsengibacter hankyongi]
MKRVVVAIYIDPDFFPPTINAILNLAEHSEEVVVISRNNSLGNYPYPSNVRLKKTGKQVSVRDSEKQPAWLKLLYFFQFTVSLLREAKHTNTSLVLLYDPFALFSFFMIRGIRRKRKVWYHNHDMPDKYMQRKYSLGYMASKYEAKAMKHIDFFSLPSKERLQYYKAVDAAIPVFVLPNYPSLKVYNQPVKNTTENSKIKIIYQGFIGKGHALEECIELLQEKIQGYELNLVLKGSVTPGYKLALNTLAEKYNVANKLIWKDIGPYYELPALTASCDIGIGINMNNDIVSQAQGTASNKIYEYAASGLPVILYNSSQFTQYLEKYDWAFFTDGSVKSLKENIEAIVKDVPSLRESAQLNFRQSLNFEKYFMPVLNIVSRSIT